MPEFRIRESGEVVNDLARAFPNVSFPAVVSPEDLDALGVDPVLEAPHPATTRFQSAYRDGVEQVNSKWFTKWSVVDWSEDAIAAATEQQWASVRLERGRRLAESDWTQLPDSALTDAQRGAWTDYRQALRNVTEQSDPFAIEWPAQP